MLDAGDRWLSPNTRYARLTDGDAAVFFAVEKQLDTNTAPVWNYQTRGYQAAPAAAGRGVSPSGTTSSILTTAG